MARRVALFFGSFSPIHIGHIALGNYIAEFCGVDEVRFVVSPHNPLKEHDGLIDDALRLEMVKVAVRGYDKFSVSDIEFSLPRPSFTYDTLKALKENEFGTEFVLIMGGDNLDMFRKWRNYDRIMQEHEILVYPRPHSSNVVPSDYVNMKCVDAPLMDISSTFIRNAIQDGRDVRYFMPNGIFEMAKKALCKCNN